MSKRERHAAIVAHQLLVLRAEGKTDRRLDALRRGDTVAVGQGMALKLDGKGIAVVDEEAEK